MERPRFTALHPEASFNASKDIVERLLMDNAHDEVFVLESTRGLDEASRREVRKALDNMARRSRHIAEHLIDTLRVRRTGRRREAMEKLSPPALPAHPFT